MTWRREAEAAAGGGGGGRWRGREEAWASSGGGWGSVARVCEGEASAGSGGGGEDGEGLYVPGSGVESEPVFCRATLAWFLQLILLPCTNLFLQTSLVTCKLCSTHPTTPDGAELSASCSSSSRLLAEPTYLFLAVFSSFPFCWSQQPPVCCSSVRCGFRFREQVLLFDKKNRILLQTSYCSLCWRMSSAVAIQAPMEESPPPHARARRHRAGSRLPSP